MIRIDRSGVVPPDELLEDGEREREQNIEPHVDAGTLASAHFKGAIYASAPVKALLWETQHHKCCYCEHRYERKWSTVEHFRPKTSMRDEAGSVTKPGYWWLAYAIENLYFACTNCNTPKNDWFPVAAGERRYQHPELPWSSEYHEPALIIDPGRDDPETHITFVRDPTVGGRYRIAPLDDRGDWTIRACALDLDELRDDHYARAIAPALRLTSGPEKLTLAKSLAASGAEFALLARVAFREAGLDLYTADS